MRPLPILNQPDFIYLRLKALTWVTNEGSWPRVLQANAGRTLAHVIEKVESQKPLIIDCRGIGEIDDHALESTRSIIQDLRRPIVLFNTSSVEEWLRKELADYSLIRPGNSVVLLFGEYIDPVRVNWLIEQSHLAVKQYLTSCVRDSFRKYEGGQKRMASTPLLASGVFDARHLISDPTKFVWTSLSMADALEDFLDQSVPAGTQTTSKPFRPFRLLAVSLRGSPFAAAVGLLTGRHNAIEIVDHMGPKYKILEEPSRTTKVDEDYIYIGDFVVGGTELRIAEAYARTKGSRIKHAIVVGRMLKNSDYTLDFETSSLVDLRTCCPNEKFVFLES